MLAVDEVAPGHQLQHVTHLRPRGCGQVGCQGQEAQTGQIGQIQFITLADASLHQSFFILNEGDYTVGQIFVKREAIRKNQ